MTLLALNPLVSPDPGLFIWSTVAFLILFFLLSKFAWKPIVKALDERERSIEDALSKAEMAKAEMAKLISENEDLLKEARLERDNILKEAKEIKDQIINDAKDQAKAEGTKLIEKAKDEITNQKLAAMAEIKNQVSSLSLAIAEKVLRKQLEDQDKQQALVNDLLKEVKLN
ncbi:MAG: ATP synthase F0 subunit B [Sphingobacteriales bacterium 17-39-43]|uniref:F0F1 ATP synthase subunit B n=1 Tax=Daejeonella sp. TaxID=2805397 RepID=UPI000BCFE6D3|nr:F0F1 ATP synthase subunit B [Daejeonella sp.]MCF8452782.1 F0F1 ATP synthase subunit B [Pedobacter sp.]OYZ31099.1 MAG: ATP synthase F0 subunit B [Sphingobacteriales bacterium 16-39-50]OZA23940.1 MAG: ATP synthase F0 subunit B [Sphingobacteriales bacterium 17-39-43]OZA61694.1 MAG: ATP synthase F0 subunit B [Sphingobacteriales bacterium 39-40-5]HQS51070.1 F0F1 ATP synthase subunit B [Daejeonella sp.]